MTDDKGLGLKSWLSGPGRREAKGQGQAETRVSNKHRVAVLPFASMSPDPTDEYFADGMTEEVISTLSRVPDVEVIARTSVMRYKKDPKPIKEVSSELDVGTVLEGSVRKAGNRLRISIQIVDPARERPVWSDSFDRELQDVFAIQTEVAARVAQALLIKKYGGKQSERKSPTSNPEAYALYLKGRYYWNKRGTENLKMAIDCFERSIREDPGFALGYFGLADALGVISSNYRSAGDYYQKSKIMIDKALELDPGLAEANATRGLLLIGEYRLDEAEKEIKTTLGVNPNYAPAHLWYYHIMKARLRWDEAIKHIERAVTLDPLSPNMYVNLAGYYRDKGDYQTALDICKRAVSLDPEFSEAHWLTGQMYGLMKLFDEAAREFGIFADLERAAFPLIAKSAEIWQSWLRSDKEAVRRMLPLIEKNQETSYLDSVQIAGLHFFLGDDDNGFDRLERGYSQRDTRIIWINSSILVPGRVKSDLRYRNLIKKLGLN